MQPIVLRNSAPAERVWYFYLYVSAVVVAGTAVAAPFLWAVPGLVWRGSTAFWLMVLLALLADVRPYVPSGACRTSAIYPSVCFTFAIMLTSGLGAAVLVQWLAVVVHTWLHRDFSLRPLFTAGQYAVSFGVAYGVLAGFGALPFLPAGRYQVVVVVLAALVWFVTSHLLVSVVIWLWSGGTLTGIVRRTAGYEVLSRIGLLLLAAVLAGAAVSSSSPWLVPLVLVPLYAVYRTARLAEQHERLVMLDPLTGLANRKALRVRIEQETAAGPGGSPGSGRFALLLLDLDRFKEVNDTLGHGVGDRLLVEVAHRLSRAADPRHLVARLGGDEFAVLAPEMDQAMAMDLARRIGRLLSEPVQLDGMPLDVHSSIGVASFPEHGDDYASLMRCADVAMYQAKSRGDTVATYQPETDHHSTHRLGLLGELRRVLDAPQDAGIELYYQPQIAIATGEVVAVEALLRWNHPERGYVDPEELIRVAEHSAVMRLLTSHVLGEVTRQLAEWETAGHTVRAAVNVSVRDLHAPEFADRLADLLVAHGVRSEQLQLEITEGALMADSRRVLATLRRLSDLGVTLSLDDFGTGYSSMLHLRRMPLKEVKIDRSFVLGMSHDEDDVSIVRSIIELATALELRVVAEGVEDERTWRRLGALGCHIAQGWFFARPMPASELPSWLANYRPPRLLRSLAPETII